jgi:hypothetical protein
VLSATARRLVPDVWKAGGRMSCEDVFLLAIMFGGGLLLVFVGAMIGYNYARLKRHN